MIDTIQRYIETYSRWLNDRTALRQIDATWVEVTTPYLDRHNDCMQIYIRFVEDHTIEMTDEGATIQDLTRSGCDLKGKRRQAILHTILNGFGVQQEGDALNVTATPETFAQKKHMLMQAMLAVDDMFYVAQANVTSVFLEDATAWLNLSHIRYVPEVKITGKSGLDHTFEFVIPRSDAVAQERLVQTMNQPSRQSVEHVIYNWIEVRDRREHSSAFALINDQEREPGDEILQALRNYQIQPILWGQREQSRLFLAS